MGGALLAGMLSARAADPLVGTPLASKSGPRGATMFAVLPPAQTGVITTNQYADPKMWGERYQEFALGAIGTGIAVGDYDNDGRPDIFAVSKTEGCRLFRNLGGWKFEDVTVKAGIEAAAAGVVDAGLAWMKGKSAEAANVEAWKQGATFADVNNDGWLDIYLCRFNAPNQLFINQRDGTFKEEAAARGLAVVDASGMGAFCDYDRDGWLDVYVQTNMLDAPKRPNGQRDFLFHNNGDGTFTNVTDRAGIGGENLAHSATWWDFDGDGWPDLYVSNDFAPSDSLYRNNRDGTFTNVINQVVPHMPYSSMGADVGDVNNDGLVDFYVADMAATTHEKDQRGMADSRVLNKENDSASGAAPQYSRNALFLNTGRGVMLEGATLAGLQATDWTWTVRWEDLDNDGRLDLYVTNGMNREYQNSDLRQRIIVAESLEERMRTVKSSPVLAEEHLAYRNLGDLQFERIGAAWGLNQVGVSFGAAFGDFDGDGDLDIVYANYEAGVTLLRNDSDSGHRLIVALRGTQSNRFGVGATVKIETKSGVQVRPLVLARGYLSSSEPVLHFGLGNETTIQKLTVEWPSGVTQTFADLAADQKLTLTEPATPRGNLIAPVAGGADPGVGVRAGFGPASARPATGAAEFTDVSGASSLALVSREKPGEEVNAQALLPTRLNRRGPAAAVGDLNGDGVDDLIVGGTTLEPLRVLLGNATTGAFAPDDASTLTWPSPLNDGPVLIFDADGDGHPDVLVTKSGANRPSNSPDYQPKLFLNDGRGTFRAAAPDALPPLPISTGAVAAADFDHDGQLDLFLGGRVQPGQYPLPARSALLLNRGGKFEDVTEKLAPALQKLGLVTSALWSDVDQDGWPDLVVALEWGGVRYFHNQAGQGFEDRSTAAGFAAAGTGWWTSLASADFNGDGRPDYVAGNVGLNTPYHATPDKPTLLYHGNFNVGGLPQLIEAYWEGDAVYPRRTRNELAAKIPAVLKKFPKNDAYAKATLTEVLGADKLAAAKQFAATELRSGVFLSQPDGTYRFAPLPRLAQIAPMQGIVTGDFDGDGRMDLYAVQNSFAPVAVIGRFDGGVSQLLRGDGQGGFTAVPAGESGLIVPGDAKALVVIDLDHDQRPDFFLTRNNGSTAAWRSTAASGAGAVRIELKGRAGNPTAIGARVEVEFADGTKAWREVSAGGGYFSQSSAATFFAWKSGHEPKRLRVRWPDGAETTQPWTPGATTVTVTQPAR